MTQEELKKYDAHLDKLKEFLNSIADDNIYQNIKFYNSFPSSYFLSPNFIEKYDFDKNFLNIEETTVPNIDTNINKEEKKILILLRVMSNLINLKNGAIKDTDDIKNFQNMFLYLYKSLENDPHLKQLMNMYSFRTIPSILFFIIYNYLKSDFNNFFDNDIIKECLNSLEYIEKNVPSNIIFIDTDRYYSLYLLFKEAFEQKQFFDKFQNYDFSQLDFIFANNWKGSISISQLYKDSILFAISKNKITYGALKNLSESFYNANDDTVYLVLDNLINSKQDETTKTNKITNFLLKTFFKLSEVKYSSLSKDDIKKFINLVNKYYQYIDIDKIIEITKKPRFDGYGYSRVTAYYLTLLTEMQKFDMQKFLQLAEAYINVVSYVSGSTEFYFNIFYKYNKIEYFDDKKYFQLFLSFLFIKLRKNIVDQILNKKIDIILQNSMSKYRVKEIFQDIMNLFSRINNKTLVQKIFKNCSVVLSDTLNSKASDYKVDAYDLDLIKILMSLDIDFELNLSWDVSYPTLLFLDKRLHDNNIDLENNNEILYFWKNIMYPGTYEPLLSIFQNKKDQWNTIRARDGKWLVSLFNVYNTCNNKGLLGDFVFDSDFYHELTSIVLAQTLMQ